MKEPCVYIMANKPRGTLYAGVTSNLQTRSYNHKFKATITEGFTADHGVNILVWYERHETMEAAIHREKSLKKWNRLWKMQLELFD